MHSSRATLLHYLGQHKVKLLTGILLVAGSSFVAVLPPLLIGRIVDALTTGANLDLIGRLALIMVALAAVENVLRGLGRLRILDSSRRIEYGVRNDLLAHLQTMHLAYFQHQRIGDLMARLTNDLQAVRQMIGFGILMLTNTLMTLLFTFVSMFGVNTKLALITLILTPISSYVFWTIGRRVNRRFEQLQSQFGDLSAKAQENFSGIRVVKAFSQEEDEIRAFAKVNRDYLNKAVDLAMVNGLLWPAMQFILGAALLTILYVGGQDAIEKQLTIGQLVQFVAYLQLISWPMIALGEVTNMIQQGAASLGRLQHIFEARPAITDPIDPVTTPIKGAVEFKGISFAYGQAVVLRDISFSVPAGGSLAIVGPTGSGKSTLVNLIPRLFDAQQGEITIDGIDVKRYPLPQLRRAVGYVPQETFLFSVPLRENVGFGRDTPLAESELEWAGDVSQLGKDVADFPARYDTMIGERGVTLSGGQKQRTAIARAVAKDPRILILDDALSAVDTYTEAEILKRLRGVMRERTSIVVAHRISTVKDADEILVLDDGVIAERGTHRDLLERNGLYAAMYRRQLLEEELEVDEEQSEHDKRVRTSTAPEQSAPPRARRIDEMPADQD
ncbi:MAG: ABC transporter ATP-binding protein [Chloroflexi bacterium]|nr:MAG: ABC transporter ATP-binding protein [Chloroflexota bacterium]TMC30302.1 MAG: ABC transporter ATP-binding protein [Chloroflexota bacterium]